MSKVIVDKALFNKLLSKSLPPDYEVLLSDYDLNNAEHDFYKYLIFLININTQFKLSFDVDPLSSLVALCDILEDFERPILSINHNDSEDNTDKDCVQFNIKPQCIYSEIECSGQELLIRYAYAENAYRIRNYKFRTEEVSEYLDNHNGYINILPIGFTSAKCECVLASTKVIDEIVHKT